MKLVYFSLLILLFSFSKFLEANAGIPLIVVGGGIFVTLIPVILVEAFLIKNPLRLNFKRALLLSLLANLASTAVGFIVLYEKPDLTLVFRPFAVFLVFFVGSVLLESCTAYLIEMSSGTEKIKKDFFGAFLKANIVSYGLLLIIYVLSKV